MEEASEEVSVASAVAPSEEEAPAEVGRKHYLRSVTIQDESNDCPGRK